jgi:signal transduction histidine kinase
MTRTAALRAALGAVTAALVGGGFALGLQLGNVHNGLIAASFTVVGLYVVHQRPGNREGWLFVATGVAHAVMFAGRQYGLRAGPLPAAAWIGWLGVWPLPMVLVLAFVTLMSFPTGQLPSPGWRPVVAVLAVLAVLLAGCSALWPVEHARVGLVAAHPFQLPGDGAAEAFYRVARPVGYLLFQLVAAAGVVFRLRRAQGDEVRQLRWFVYAVATTAVLMVTGLLLWRSPLLGVLAVPVVALAAGTAILKHRLYDIDPVINKTLVFGALAALVTAGYVLVVTGVGSLVDGHGRLLSLVATALVAVVFEPSRRRIQQLADRLVYGRRTTPYETLARLSAQLSVPTGGLLDGMCATIADGVGARRVVLWTGSRQNLRAVSGWPPSSALPTDVRQIRELDALPVVHDGTFIGAITVTKPPGEGLTVAEKRLLTDLAAQAGLILELRASAARLVAAGDTARRRLERDLHDGAQQHLVLVAVELGALVQSATETGNPELAARARSAREQALQATAELREMARGLHPAVLTQDGLEAAIGYLADRSTIPVRLSVAVGKRLAPEIEAMAYFVVSEGLVNAAKHAGAGLVVVRAQSTSAGLELELSDDGCGGASVRAGGGLEGLSDRLATLGARLALDSGPSGTTLGTTIPCG